VVISNFAEVITQAVAVLVEDVQVRFTWAMIRTNGQFQFRLTGNATTKPYVIQAATNLSSISNMVIWEPVYTNPSPATPLDWQDSSAALHRQRFYRAVFGP
jgi:hypothetical protein